MEGWVQAYFHASDMQLLTAEQQLAYLKARVVMELRLRLKGTLPADPMRQECYDTLDKLFLEKYPLFQRRLSWVQFCKRKDAPIKETYYNLKALADGGNMGNMSIDNWHVSGYIPIPVTDKRARFFTVCEKARKRFWSRGLFVPKSYNMKRKPIFGAGEENLYL